VIDTHSRDYRILQNEISKTAEAIRDVVPTCAALEDHHHPAVELMLFVV